MPMQMVPFTYFCQYCGYEFLEPPVLPTRCPRCGRLLKEVGHPIIAPAKKRKSRHGKRWRT